MNSRESRRCGSWQGQAAPRECAKCSQPVYINGEGTWFGPDGAVMCANCAPSAITPDRKRVWNPEKGCWEEGG